MRGFVVVRLNNAKAKHANTIAQPARVRAHTLQRYFCVSRGDAPLYLLFRRPSYCIEWYLDGAVSVKNAPASPASLAKSSNPRMRAISSRRRLAGLATLPATLSISDTRSPVSSSSSSIAFRNSRLAFFCAVHSCKHGSLQYGADFCVHTRPQPSDAHASEHAYGADD